jgi:hypothetical protein
VTEQQDEQSQQQAVKAMSPEMGVPLVARQGGIVRLPVLAVGGAGFVAGGAAVYLFGMDSLWPALVGGVVVAVAAVLVDVLGLAKLGERRHKWGVQVAVVVVMAGLAAAYYGAERREAMREAFGVASVPGVSGVDVDRLVGKENGRKLLVVEFQASREALDALLAARKFNLDRLTPIKPGRERKAQRSLWGHAFSRYGLSVEDRWKNRLPVLQPVIYEWTGHDRETVDEQTSVLWDAASGRGCAIHASS